MTKVSFKSISQASVLLAAAVTPSLAQRFSSGSSDPCEALAELGLQSGGTSVTPQSALNCLATIPMVKDNAIKTIAGLKRFLEFQSTIAYIKNPPKSSSQEPVDLLKELDNIAEKVDNGDYDNQIDFETDVSSLFSIAHDGHLSASFTASNIITWRAPFAIVSLSKDGTDLPEIYASEDVEELEAGLDVSPISKLDDEDVNDYLEKLANLDASQSPDTRWNDLMLTNIRNGYANLIAAGSFYLRSSYPGKREIKVSFKNGTEATVPYQAIIVQDLSGVTSGADIYNAFALRQQTRTRSGKIGEKAKMNHNMANVVPAYAKYVDGESMHPGIRHHLHQKKKRQQKKQQKARRQFEEFSDFRSLETEVPEVIQFPTAILTEADTLFPAPTATGTGSRPTGGSSSGVVFPGYEMLSPEIVDPSNICAGFYLNDDTAVLALVGFAPTQDDSPRAAPGFQKTIEAFLAGCKRSGKTRLIIDVHGNGGGIVGLGFDLLKQLFPSLDPFSAQRFRASEAARIEGQAFSDLEENNVTDITAAAIASSLRYQNMLQVNGKPFNSFKDYFGPKTYNDDDFTNLNRLNLDDPNSYGTPSISITGHGDRARLANREAVFDPENIVFLSDGVCASTCTIVAEVLQNQLGVKTVAVGGRPRKGSMAAIGGTRGCQAVTFEGLLADSAAVIVGLGDYSTSTANELPLPVPLAVSGGVNYCDNIRNNTKDVPLQFIDEPADCRIYWTASTFLDPSKLWKQVHDIRWGNGKCAEGGLKSKGSRIGTSGNSTDSGKKSDAPALKSSGIALVTGLAVIAAMMLV